MTRANGSKMAEESRRGQPHPRALDAALERARELSSGLRRAIVRAEAT